MHYSLSEPLGGRYKRGSMGPPKSSISHDPFGTTLPPDVLGAALEQFNDIVMVAEGDPAQGLGLRVLYVNPAFERITGYPAEEVLGRSPRFMQAPAVSSSEVRRIEEALAARRPIRAEFLNFRKDGSHCGSRSRPR